MTNASENVMNTTLADAGVLDTPQSGISSTVEADFDQDKNLRRVVVSSVIGAVIEWYDFFLYGVVASLFFNQLYFPTMEGTVGTIMALGTFAVGFVARPLGGIIFGHFGDKLGRKKILILTLQIMGVATVGIGLVPTYDQIGIWAPILLVVFRLAQGIGLGGEWGGAVLMSFESAPAGKRAFYGSLPQVGMSLGLLLASGVVALLQFALTAEQFLSWGWRAAFVASVILLIVGHYMRTSIKETPDFEEAKKKASSVKYPLLDAFKRYPRKMLACMGARFIDGVSFNVYAVFSLSYMKRNLGVSDTVALIAVCFAAFIMTLAIPFWGYVADRIGKAKIYGTGAVILGFMSFPTFSIIQAHADNPVIISLALGIPFGIVHAAVFSTMAGFFSESFDASVRYSGISFVYQFTAIFASGLTPIVATLLTAAGGGSPFLFCAYLAVVGVMSAACSYWLYKLGDKAA